MQKLCLFKLYIYYIFHKLNLKANSFFKESFVIITKLFIMNILLLFNSAVKKGTVIEITQVMFSHYNIIDQCWIHGGHFPQSNVMYSVKILRLCIFNSQKMQLTSSPSRSSIMFLPNLQKFKVSEFNTVIVHYYICGCIVDFPIVSINIVILQDPITTLFKGNFIVFLSIIRVLNNELHYLVQFYLYYRIFTRYSLFFLL